MQTVTERSRVVTATQHNTICMYIVESLMTSIKDLYLVVFVVEIRAILVEILYPFFLNTLLHPSLCVI